jgi:hypothetical protein
MIDFKNWLSAQESSASTRRATGPYPPQPNDFFIRPPYGKENTCAKIGEFKPINMDVSKICGSKKKGKGKSKKNKDVK